jgi:ADP-ribosyl-[dinitrogen reductase] hydrolase
MKGSCLCGTVAFEAEPPADGLRIAFCSCPTCRKAHAAPCNVSAPVPRDGFRWTRGAAEVRTYRSSPGKLRHFCGTCGSHLMAEHPGQATVLLRVALLDEDPGARPAEWIHRAHAAPWCDPEAPGIARYEGEPTP